MPQAAVIPTQEDNQAEKRSHPNASRRETNLTDQAPKRNMPDSVWKTKSFAPGPAILKTTTTTAKRSQSPCGSSTMEQFIIFIHLVCLLDKGIRRNTFSPFDCRNPDITLLCSGLYDCICNLQLLIITTASRFRSAKDYKPLSHHCSSYYYHRTYEILFYTSIK